MAMALDASIPCPHCGREDETVRASVYWLLFDTDASAHSEQLGPPNPLDFTPLSRSEVLLVSAGLLGVLAVGITPVILLSFLMQQIGGLIILFSFVWALACPVLYLHVFEKHVGDEALARWNNLMYCQN